MDAEHGDHVRAEVASSLPWPFTLQPKLDSEISGQTLDAAMNASQATAITHDAERLTWAEICKRFPDEWVVLVDADWTNDRDFEFGTALVLGHRKDRKEASIDVKAAFLHYQSVGCFWTGEIRGPLPRFSSL